MRVTVGSALRLQLMLLFRQYFRLVLPQTALQEFLVPSADTVCIAIYAGNLDYWESLGIQKLTHSHTNMSNMGGLTALLQKHSICRDSWASTFVLGNVCRELLQMPNISGYTSHLYYPYSLSKGVHVCLREANPKPYSCNSQPLPPPYPTPNPETPMPKPQTPIHNP